MLASILGLPIVNPSWVEACVDAKARLPLSGEHVLQEARAPCRAFRGKRVSVCGKPVREVFAALLQYAGEPTQQIPL